MGGAMSAVTGGVASVVWNPGGISTISGRELMFTHMSSFSGLVSTNNLFAGLRRGDWGFAAGFYMVSSSGLIRTAYDSTAGRIVPAGEFGYRFTSFYFGAARNGLGVTIKAVQETIDTVTAIGIGLDVGVQKTIKGIRMGAVIHDLTSTPIVWSTGLKEFILPNVRLGLAYTYRSLTASAESEVRFENMETASTYSVGILSLDPHLGIEWNIHQRIIDGGDFFSIRLGLDRTIPTFGAGFKTKWASIDYAFITHSVLGGSHRISITASF